MSADTNSVDVQDSPRLRVLKASLEKKQARFDERIGQHFAAVRAANGQPLNDKRNGASTLKKWAKQEDALRSLQEGIETTSRAIERERSAIARAAEVDLPDAIKRGIADGLLIQWRKHPTTFFVAGVEKARIVLLPDGQVAHRYARCITDPEQRRVFARVYNAIHAEITETEAIA